MSSDSESSVGACRREWRASDQAPNDVSYSWMGALDAQNRSFLGQLRDRRKIRILVVQHYCKLRPIRWRAFAWGECRTGVVVWEILTDELLPFVLREVTSGHLTGACYPGCGIHSPQPD